jgi:hypothetical protein
LKEHDLDVFFNHNFFHRVTSWTVIKSNKLKKKKKTLIPVEVTRGEFEVVQEFRRDAQPDEESDSPAVLDATLKVLVMIRSQTRSAASGLKMAEVVTTDAQ